MKKELSEKKKEKLYQLSATLSGPAVLAEINFVKNNHADKAGIKTAKKVLAGTLKTLDKMETIIAGKPKE